MTRLSNCARREWLSLILGIILVIFGLSLFWGPLGPRDLLALRYHRRLLETKRAELHARNQALRASVQRLGSDRRYLENLIRRELGFARSNELVYKFADPQNPDTR